MESIITFTYCSKWNPANSRALRLIHAVDGSGSSDSELKVLDGVFCFVRSEQRRWKHSSSKCCDDTEKSAGRKFPKEHALAISTIITWFIRASNQQESLGVRGLYHQKYFLRYAQKCQHVYSEPDQRHWAMCAVMVIR